MRLKTTINYQCPNYTDQISSPLIIRWMNENYNYLPKTLLYLTVQVETQQIGVKLTIDKHSKLTESDIERLRKLKADIIGWSYLHETETHYLTQQVRFQLDHYWVSIDAFIQALEANRQIKPVISGRLLGIGGLSGYFYQTSGLVITNATAIYNDLLYNRIPSALVDYNTYQIPETNYQTILINIGFKGLTPNLKSQLPKLTFQRLYYIGCQIEKNRQDLDYFGNRADEYRFTEVEYENVWLITVDSLSWNKTSKSRTLVPLGTTCCIAYNLDLLGLRHQAFPFDWVKMTLNQLLTVLEDDFQKWFELTVVKTSDQHPLLVDNWEDNRVSTLVVQNSYGVKFYHDFKATDTLEAQLPAFIEKYTRRINRFRLTDSSCEFIVYAHKANPDTLTKIAKLIRGPLTVICNNDIELDSVRILKANGIHIDWKLSNFDWANHF